MDNKLKISLIALAILLIALTGFFLGRETKKPVQVIKYIKQIDSVWSFVPAETLMVTAKGKIQYKEREILVYKPVFLDTCKPFITTIDTLIKKDTLLVRYEYPQNVFSVILRQAPDSVLTRTITINADPVIVEKPWYEIPAYVAGSLLVGYGLGRIK